MAFLSQGSCRGLNKRTRNGRGEKLPHLVGRDGERDGLASMGEQTEGGKNRDGEGSTMRIVRRALEKL